jgi:hypothetical protein
VIEETSERRDPLPISPSSQFALGIVSWGSWGWIHGMRPCFYDFATIWVRGCLLPDFLFESLGVAAFFSSLLVWFLQICCFVHAVR